MDKTTAIIILLLSSLFFGAAISFYASNKIEAWQEEITMQRNITGGLYE